MPTTISVVGGGASGALTAAHLLRRATDPDLRVVLHEPAPVPARGVAYRTTDRRHLLNVRSRDMSALPDEPGHLVAWAERTGRPSDPVGFLPRATWAHYLTDVLEESRRSSVATLEVRRESVVDVAPASGGRFLVRGRDATTEADRAVLAYGNLEPRPLRTEQGAVPDAPWHVGSAWDAAALAALPQDATVVLVGSGLTAVDAALSLLGDHPARRVVMLSRTGLLPHSHLPSPCSTSWATPMPSGPLTADGLAAHVVGQIARARHHGVCWRSVVDGLRGATQRTWTRLEGSERRCFLSRHARHWEVLRHRMAPDVAARIRAYVDAGRLQVVGGGLAGVEDLGTRCRVTPGGGGEAVVADAVVNCTGPTTDLDASTSPLLASLRRRGLVVGDPLGLGVRCTPEGAVLRADGDLVPGLHVVGPPRKGALWETTAVPEIRSQAAELADLLLDG